MIGRDSFILPEVEEFNIPSRKLSIYQDIYDFEAYEFSNCIAYECAVRNDDVLSEISIYYTLLKKDLSSNFNFNKLNTFGIDEDVVKHILFRIESFRYDTDMSMTYKDLCVHMKENSKELFESNTLLSQLYDNSFIAKQLTTKISCPYATKNTGEVIQILEGSDTMYYRKDNEHTILHGDEILDKPLQKISISMHRPKMINPNNHKRFLVEININSELSELQEQIKVIKEAYEDNKKEDELYKQKSEKETNKIIRDKHGYLDDKKVRFANILNGLFFNANKKELLSSSELFFHNTYSELPPKKKLKLKQDTYIDILWVYDVMTSFHLYTEACKKQKEESIKSLTNKVNIIRLDDEDRRILKSRIIDKFEDKQTRVSEVINQLFKELKSKHKDAKVSVVEDRYKRAKDLIENKKYLHLI